MTRFGYAMLTYLTLFFIILTCVFRPSAHFLWNTTPSVPTGLYALARADSLQRNDLVAVMAPAPLSHYMSERFYLPLGLPLIKHVAAIPGDTACRHGFVISINGRPVATAQAKDHARRPLPVWQGCYTLTPNQIFLLNPGVPDSFDGRYFGLLPMGSVLGRTLPLWTGTRDRAP